MMGQGACIHARSGDAELLYALYFLFHRLTRTTYLYNGCLPWYNVVLTSRVHSTEIQSTVTAADSCGVGINVLNHFLSWSKFVNSHLSHSRQWFNIHFSYSLYRNVAASLQNEKQRRQHEDELVALRERERKLTEEVNMRRLMDAYTQRQLYNLVKSEDELKRKNRIQLEELARLSAKLRNIEGTSPGFKPEAVIYTHCTHLLNLSIN